MFSHRCKRECAALGPSDGRGGKAIRRGHHHHQAWNLPTHGVDNPANGGVIAPPIANAATQVLVAPSPPSPQAAAAATQVIVAVTQRVDCCEDYVPLVLTPIRPSTYSPIASVPQDELAVATSPFGSATQDELAIAVATSPFAFATQNEHELAVATSPFASGTQDELLPDAVTQEADILGDPSTLAADATEEEQDKEDEPLDNNDKCADSNDDSDDDSDDDNYDIYSLSDLESDLILHHPVQEEMVVDVPDVDDVEEVLDDEEEEEIFTKKYTFAELDNESVKLVSFPDMKTKIEGKLCCKICAKKKNW